MMIYAVSRVLQNALEQHPLLSCGDLGDLHCVPFETGYSSITVRIDKLQALLSCFSTSWTEVSFSLCSSPTRTLPLQVCAASAAVNHSRRILQTLLIRPAFSLKSCLALRCLTHSHCSQGCHGMSVSPQIPWLCASFQQHCDDTFGCHVPALF